MEFKEIVKNRYACRQYLDKKVPEETIRELLEIMSYSVSAINLQPWRIKVVSDQETKDKLFEATWGQNQVKTCSHLLVLCADVDYPAIIAKFDKTLAAANAPDDMRSAMVELAANVSNGMSPEQKLQWSQNQVYIMLGNAVNGAYSLGLASGPMTAFQPGEFAKILKLPANIVPTALVAVGYPADKFLGKMRYPVDEILI
ncbi:MAG: nitroreductase family protein [Actinobacteria bacterium]|nr:nitroreductase family protein [Actinomycetota bacterium]